MTAKQAVRLAPKGLFYANGTSYEVKIVPEDKPWKYSDIRKTVALGGDFLL